MLFVSIKHPVFSNYIFMTLPMLPALLLFNLGVSLVLAALYVFFRDVMHFYNVFLTLWMYLTPIFYKLQRLGQTLPELVMGLVMKLNPMAHFVEYFRDIVYRMKLGTAAEATVSTSLGTLYVIGIAFAIFGMLIFSLTKRKFIFSI